MEVSKVEIQKAKISNYLIYCFFALLTFSIWSCKEEGPDRDQSIFDTSTPELNSFDKWLRRNYVTPYNMVVFYRLRDVETDFNYNVIPADLQKAKQMAYLLKYLWLDAYEEVAAQGIHFVRTNAPRIMHFIGSAEWDESTMRLGTAEGGLKITVTDVNALIPKEIANQYYFNTIHHEFAHILHQTKDYPSDFRAISAGNYMPSQWYNRTDAEAAATGFVSNYAGSQPQEDFVETLSRYITLTPEQWEEKHRQAGPYGSAIIMQKLNVVKKYMRDSWGVDVDLLKEVIMRRSNEIRYFDFDNLENLPEYPFF